MLRILSLHNIIPIGKHGYTMCTCTCITHHSRKRINKNQSLMLVYNYIHSHIAKLDPQCVECLLCFYIRLMHITIAIDLHVCAFIYDFIFIILWFHNTHIQYNCSNLYFPSSPQILIFAKMIQRTHFMW